MSAYLDDLKVQAAQAMAVQKERTALACEAARDRLTPLETRLAQLLRTIPPEVQREGLSLTALRQQLKGRWRGTCHPGELGAALRKLGFVRRRIWRDDGGFRAHWLPRA